MSLITGQSQEDAKAIEEAVCDRLREIQADAERVLGRPLPAHPVLAVKF